MASNFISCADDDFEGRDIPGDLSESNFDHGVASFDPTHSQVIIWSRYSTALPSAEILWQISTDPEFDQVVRSGELTATADRDHTFAVEVQDLEDDQKLYYRFINIEESATSVIGETLTLPQRAERIKMAVCSCSNFPAGLFNVYRDMASSDADVIVHLGDYIYEYGVGGYGTNPSTAALNRAHEPANEIIGLDEYRERYKQYRSDADLKLAHQKKPFICVWDDHEIANDAYRSGTENHQPDEGDYGVRKQNAIRAYSEFLPVRSGDINLIYRNINMGNLVNLIMLDTRIIGRDRQLDYTDYFSATGEFDGEGFRADWLNPDRTILGAEQRNWLIDQVSAGPAKWQVLGQQVLMGKMFIPAELLRSLTRILGEVAATGTTSPETLAQFQMQITELVQLKIRFIQNDPGLTEMEIARINTALPYNLDAWDGYPAERELLYAAFKGKKIVCLAGDTHNAWSSVLTPDGGEQVGREFATSAVTSPGLEGYLGSDPSALAGFEQAFTILIDDLDYVNASRKGYLNMTFTPEEVKGEWVFVDTITSPSFTASTEKTVSFS